MKFIKIPSCKDVYHQKYNPSGGEKLGLKDLVLMRLHLFMCTNCQRLESSLEFMQSKMTESIKRKIQTVDEEKVNKLKQEIKAKLKR